MSRIPLSPKGGGAPNRMRFHRSAASSLDSGGSPSAPDGLVVNIQPNARPMQLPRTRRGMNRPGSTSCHGSTCRGADVCSAACAGRESSKCGPLSSWGKSGCEDEVMGWMSPSHSQRFSAIDIVFDRLRNPDRKWQETGRGTLRNQPVGSTSCLRAFSPCSRIPS